MVYQNCDIMKRIILLLFLNILLFNVCIGRERSENEMKILAAQVIKDKLNKNLMLTRGSTSVDLQELKKMEKLSVYGLEGMGYVVISNDDRFKPVLGYSDSKFEKSDDLPCGFKWWIKTINEIMQESEVEQNEIKKFASIREANNLPQYVAPLLKTKWGQGKPYNNQCVFTINGNTISSYAGCVAIAMAQIMKFYEYPNRGNGSHSYMLTNNYGTFYPSTNFEKKYEWANMLDEYKNGSYSDIQANAVASLVYDCGVAVDMRYGGGSSPSCASSGETPLMAFFDYDDCMHLYRRDYTDEEWLKIVYSELGEGRPIMYGASSKSGYGHSFVLHGYNEDGLVYVNWGWNGESDGYYDIELLNGYSNGHTMNVIHQGLKGSETKNITISSPGTLQETLTTYLNSFHGVKISGVLNDDDMQFIHSISGDNQYYNREPAFYTIDLADATIDGTCKNILPPSQFEKTRIKKVILPNNIIGIGDRAFHQSSICSIEIPATVKTIGEWAFGNTGLYNIKIPEGVEHIGAYCFANDPDIGIMELPSSLKSIDEGAFASCRNLRALNLPEGLIRLGSRFISDCRLISEIEIPKTLRKISEQAFANSNISSIYIPSNVDSIGGGLFRQCSNIKSIIVAKDNPIYDSREDCNAIIETKTNKLVAACEHTNIPESIVMIGRSAFSWLPITSIDIPDNVFKIEASAFAGCKFKSITLPSKLKTIGDYAFDCCQNLESIDIPEGVDSIGRFCFSTCSKMKVCKLPSSLFQLSRLAFTSCKELHDIWNYSKNPESIQYDSYVRIFDDETKANAILHVISGTKEKYKKLFEWQDFQNILEFDDTTRIISKIADRKDTGNIYRVDGTLLENKRLRKGIYIKNGKKFIIK
jgi:hypothetical protein